MLSFKLRYAIDFEHQPVADTETMNPPPSEADKKPLPERHVVLVAPEVHWNTGNIGRTCLGGGAVLHLIRPLGFSLEDKHVKRAGLDYWSKVRPKVWDDFNQFLSTTQAAAHEIVLFSKGGCKPHWQMPSPRRLFMIFGSETKGLPPVLLQRFIDQTYQIPIRSEIRCLNLSTAVGIALFESLRQWVDHPSL